MGPDLFRIYQPPKIIHPIIVSFPHSGTAFPAEIAGEIQAKFAIHPPDTDWHLPKLYEFVRELGCITIEALYSRYVIDLNRNPAGSGLYGDGRKETSLVPLHAFDGQSLWKKELSLAEIERRKERYFWPYHQKIQQIIFELQKEFKHVLFYDAHSIKRLVLSIRPAPFPDFIIGTNDGKSCDEGFRQLAQQNLFLYSSNLKVNDPFKGGYLTRSIGRPKEGIHALQIERSQDIYMDEKTFHYDQLKATQLQSCLKSMFTDFAKHLGKLNA
jgi:N-formylglutamate amidohydrolase